MTADDAHSRPAGARPCAADSSEPFSRPAGARPCAADACDSRYSRPAGARLTDDELAARIRALRDIGAAGPSAADEGGPAALTDGVIRLRTWSNADMPAILAGLQDGSAAYWIVGMPHPYGPADAADFLARAERELQTAEYAHLAVVDAQTDCVLGAVGMNFRHDRQAGEIGYWVTPGFRARGTAQRAVALITRWAFEELLLPRVELIIHPLNFESQIVASRGGFRREGLLRSYLEHRGLRNDYYSFSRLPDDPAPAPTPTLRATLGTTLTADLVLRPWRMRDAEAAQAMIAGDEEISRWCIGIPDPCTVEDERRFIAEAARAWFEHGTPAFAITMEPAPAVGAAGEAGIIGSCGIEPGPASDIAMIGYFVRESARGQGVAAAALGAVSRWAVETGGFRVCEALIRPENVASVRTAERAGYVRTDESRICGCAGESSLHYVWRFPA